MKMPRVIMINAVSLDGSFVGLEFDFEVISKQAREYRKYMILEGSNSVVTGLTEMYEGTIPPEAESDFIKPDRGPGVPYSVIPDSRGITKGLLHLSRRFDFSRDVILLVTEKTDREFINYLEERNIDYLVCGEEKVDFVKAFDWLCETYGVDTIRVDGGPTLNRALLEQGVLNEIILLVHPVVVGGAASEKLLNHLTEAVEGIKLELLESREAGNGIVLLHYRVVYE